MFDREERKEKEKRKTEKLMQKREKLCNTVSCVYYKTNELLRFIRREFHRETQRQ